MKPLGQTFGNFLGCNLEKPLHLGVNRLIRFAKLDGIEIGSDFLKYMVVGFASQSELNYRLSVLVSLLARWSKFPCHPMPEQSVSPNQNFEMINLVVCPLGFIAFVAVLKYSGHDQSPNRTNSHPTNHSWLSALKSMLPSCCV